LYFEYINYIEEIETTKINAEHFEAFASLNYPALCRVRSTLKVLEYLIKANKLKKFGGS